MRKKKYLQTLLALGGLISAFAITPSLPVDASTAPVHLKDKHSTEFSGEYGFSPRFLEGQTKSFYRGFTDRQNLKWFEDRKGGEKKEYEMEVYVANLKECTKGNVQVLYKNVGNWRGKEMSLVYTVKNWTLLDNAEDNARGNLPCILFSREGLGYAISSYLQKNTVVEARLVYAGKDGDEWNYKPVEDSFKWHWTVGDLDGESGTYSTMVNDDGTPRSSTEVFKMKGSDWTAYIADGDADEKYVGGQPAIQNKIVIENTPDLQGYTTFRQTMDSTWIYSVNPSTTVGQVFFTLDKPYMEFSFGNKQFLHGWRRCFAWLELGNYALGYFEEPEPYEEVDMTTIRRDTKFNYKMIMDTPVETDEFFYKNCKMQNVLPDELKALGFTFDIKGGLSAEDKKTISESYTYNETDNIFTLNVPQSILNKPEFYGSEINIIAQVQMRKALAPDRSEIENNYNLTTRTTPKTSNTVQVKVVHKISTSVDGSGGVISESKEAVLNGSDQTVIAQAQDGYVISSLTVDGVLLQGLGMHEKNASYTFDKITEDHDIKVKFIKAPATEVEKVVEKPEYTIGEKIKYTINLENKGEASETVNVKDNLPDGLQIESVSIDKTGINKQIIEDKNLVVEPFVITGGEKVKIEVITTPIEKSCNGKVLMNTAEMEGSYTGKKSSNVSTWVNEPELRVEKSLEKTQLVEGDRVKYTVLLTQTVQGKLTAKNVHLRDEIEGDAGEVETNSVKVFVNDEKLSGTDSRIHYLPNGNGYTFNLGDLNDQDVIRVEYFVNVKPTEMDKLKNKITTSSDNTTTKTYESSTDTPIKHKYRITTSAVNGTITEFTDKVEEGTPANIEYAPKGNGYYLESVSIDGVEVNKMDYIDRVVFKNVNQNHSVHVVYQPIPKTKIKVEKEWKDTNNKNHTRPSGIVVKVSRATTKQRANGNNGQPQPQEWLLKLNEGNKWTDQVDSLDSKDQLGRDVKYNVEEVVVDNYHSTLQKITETEYKLTNTVYGQKNIVVNVKWSTPDPDVIPENVKVNLKGNGQTYTNTVNTSDNTTSFTVDAYDHNGQEITYTVNEDPVKDFTTTYPSTDKENTFEILNTYDPAKRTLTITKDWKDDNNVDQIRPDNVEIDILRNGQVYHTLTVNAPLYQETYDVPDTDKDGKPYTYTIKEHTVEGYESKVDGYTAINTIQGQISKTVNIIWKGIDQNKKPEAEVVLKANGKSIQTINTSTEYTFDHLPKYDADGKKIAYTAEETKIGNEDATKLFSVEYSEDTFTITNTRKDRIRDYVVKQEWSDYDNEDKTRPDQRKVVIIRNDGEKIEIELNKDENWIKTVQLEFEDVEGQPYSYSVDAEGVEKYTDEINDLTIYSTYTRIPEPIIEPEPKPEPPKPAPETEVKKVEKKVAGKNTGSIPDGLVVLAMSLFFILIIGGAFIYSLTAYKN